MKKFQTKTYQLSSDKISSGQRIRLAFLSDLHGSSFGRGNSLLVRAVEGASPDLVLVGGDMMVGKPLPHMEAARDLLLALARRFPVFYAFGNHERRMADAPQLYGDELHQFCRCLSGHGVRILRNECVRIDSIRGIPLAVWGLDMSLGFYKRFRARPMKPGYLPHLLGKPEAGIYHILLAHNPQFAPSYFGWGADLILSGHYHGGIWRFSENRGLASPNLRLFPAYCCGLFTQGRQHMVVSPGLGEHTLPLRIQNPRELIVLELVHGGDV